MVGGEKTSLGGEYVGGEIVPWWREFTGGESAWWRGNWIPIHEKALLLMQTIYSCSSGPDSKKGG